MRQGTTPRHTFTLPFETSIVKKVRVLYAQGGTLKIVKKENEAEMSGNTISVRLTQAETLCLNPKFKTDIQVRVLTETNDSLASEIFSVDTERCLSKEVL